MLVSFIKNSYIKQMQHHLSGSVSNLLIAPTIDQIEADNWSTKRSTDLTSNLLIS